MTTRRLFGIVPVLASLAVCLSAPPAAAEPAAAPSANFCPATLQPEAPLLAVPISPADKAAGARAVQAFAKLPLTFEANRGQTDARVKFVSRGPAHTLFLTPAEAVMVVGRPPVPVRFRRPEAVAAPPAEPGRDRGAVVRMKFVGANAEPRVTGLDPQPGTANYLVGNDRSRWRAGVPLYLRVRYQDVYPGIDVIYHGRQGQLEYDLLVKPGADPRAIRLVFEGANTIRVDEGGDLVLRASGSELRQHKPVVFQEADGHRAEIRGNYVIHHGREVSFELAAYNRGRPLLIDPMLSYSTFLGGNSSESASGLAVDSSGSVYVTGTTYSSDFPTSTDAYRRIFAFGDIFVAKLNATGTALSYATYLGGSSYDYVSGIAVDSSGNAHVTGHTSSWDFPTQSAAQSRLAGDVYFKTADAATSWSAPGSGITSSIVALAVNPTSTSTLYAGTSGGGVFKSVDGGSNWNAINSGLTNLFVNALAIDPANSSTLYAGTQGGVFKSADAGASWAAMNTGLTSTFIQALALHASNPAIVYAATFSGVFKSSDGGGSWTRMSTGLTSSSVNALAIDPATPSTLYAGTSGGVFKSANAGASWSAMNNGLPVCFLRIAALAVDPSTPSTIYAGTQGAGVYKSTDGGGNWTASNTGLFGGAYVFQIVINPATPSTLYVTIGSVYKSTDGGANWSSAGNGLVGGARVLAIDPVTPTTLHAGTYSGTDAFVTKLNANGTGLMYSTYLGGASTEYANAIAVDSAGAAYVTGFTNSGDFPKSTGAYRTTCGTYCYDAFVTKFDSAGSRSYSTLLGGNNGSDSGNGIAVDPEGNAYVTGSTSSSDFPTFTNAIRTTMAGGDAFVTKVNPSGTGLVYSTLLGGSGSDDGYGIGVDSAGNAYVTGATGSTDFPTVSAIRGSYAPTPVYKSTNAAGSWSAASTGLTSQSVTSLAIHPTTPSTLYAAADKGVFKTTNSGTSWSRTGTQLSSATLVAIDRTNPSTVYAIQFSSFWKSTDAGSTWTRTGTGLAGGRINALAINPATTSTLFAATDNGIYKSTNGGANWAPSSSGLAGLRILSVAIDPATPTTMYAGTSGGGVYKSTDDGSTWSAVISGLNYCFNYDFGVLVIDPAAPATVYAGARYSLFKTTDAGANWGQLSSAPSFIVTMAIDPVTGSTLYVGGSGYVAKSTDGGTTWLYLGQGLGLGSVNSLAVDPATTTTLYAAGFGGGDAFVARVNASGTALDYSTYLGGSSEDSARAIAVDAAGNAFVIGSTTSADFPTSNALQSGFGGGQDVFVTAFTPSGSLLFSTFLGGTGSEGAGGIALDGSGGLYVAGGAGADFPATPGAYQRVVQGYEDIFIAKIVPSTDTCTSAINPSSQSFTAASGSGLVSVIVPSGCGWTASSTAGFITITSGSSGTGLGTVSYSVAANTTGSVRAGTIAIAGQTFTVSQTASTFAQNIVFAGPGQGPPRATARIPVSLALTSGTLVDSVSFTLQVTPDASAPALSGTLDFQAATGVPAPTVKNTSSGAGVISLAWQSLATAFTGTMRLGDLIVNVPSSAVDQQTYTVAVTSPSGSLGAAAVTIVPGANVTLTVVARDYQVGDTFPTTSSAGDLNGDGDTYDAGEFGDDSLTILDLIMGLRAVTNVPNYRPPACSDRFDSIDAFPADTTSARGGDGTLGTVDLIVTLRRVTNVDTTRPRRFSRGLSCPAAAASAPALRRASDEAFDKADETRAAAGRTADLALEFGAAEATPAGNTVRVPVYLRARRATALAGLAWSVGLAGSGTLRFAAGDGRMPSVVDNLAPGLLSVAWLDAWGLTAGERLLLGYIESPALAASQSAAVLQVYGAVADAERTRRPLRVAFPASVLLRPGGAEQ